MIAVSVIMPVYNGEADLERAVASIEAQTMGEWELILVDDGSTDKTGELCDKKAAEDERIRVIHTQNQGQGIARNTGLLLAQGEYVWFADADDELLPDGMRLLYEKALEGSYDVVSGLYYREKGRGRELILGAFTEGELKRRGTKEEEGRFHRVKTESVFGYLWNKLYRRQFLVDKGLAFDDIKKVYMEDQLFNLKVFGKNPRYYQSLSPVYCYYVVTSSTTRRADDKIAEKNCRMLKEYADWLTREGIFEENKDLLVPLAARVICWSLIKNTAYEGISFLKMKERLRVFTRDEKIQKILGCKGCYQSLSELPGRLQSAGYSFLLFLWRRRAENITAFLFLCLFPMLKLYIKRTVK